MKQANITQSFYSELSLTMQTTLLVSVHKCVNWWTPMEQSPWQVSGCSAHQQTTCLLGKMKVHDCVHKSLPYELNVNQMNPIDILTAYLSKAHFNTILSSHLRLGFPRGLFPSGFSTKILYHFSFITCVLLVLSIPSFLVIAWVTKQIMKPLIMQYFS